MKLANNGLVDLLEQIDILVKDTSVPGGIKNALADVRQCLTSDDCDLHLRKDNAQVRLVDIADDPNVPINGRTVVWDVLSRIESL